MAKTEGGLASRVLRSPLVGALTWPYGVDRYLQTLNPTWSVNTVRGTVTGVRHQTNDTVTLTISPNSAWLGHRAGQFVNVGVEIEGTIHTRCYSVTTSSHDDRNSEIEFTLKAHPDGLVSRHLAKHAHVGMMLRLSQAEGEFTLPTVRPSHAVMISGGSGITPVLSMLRTLCDESAATAVTFVHYSLGAVDSLYRDELDELGKNPNVQLVRGYVTATGGDLHGNFDRDHLDRIAPDWQDAEIYVCGPTGLMDAVTDVVTEAGCEDRLHTERFVTVRAPLPEDAAQATGNLAFSGAQLEVANDGATILEQAEGAGLSPKYGCRMGICHTCTRPKTAGCVRNVLTGQLSRPDAEEIQLCISVPVGDVIVDL